MDPPLPPPSTPVLTVKAFFISVGIFIGFELLICIPVFIKIYIRRRRRQFKDPSTRALWKLFNFVLEMKAVIEYIEARPGLIPLYDDKFGVLDHILYMFKRIDQIPLKGRWPKGIVRGPGMHEQAVVDVTWGEEPGAV